MSQKYSFDQDEVWEAAANAAEKAVEKAQRVGATRCVKLCIPKQFAPFLHLQWCNRGYDNAVKKQCDQLRNVAKTQIEAIEKKAITEIEMECLNAQEQIAVAGLTSEAAKAFIESLPSIEKPMPPLSFDEIAGESKPSLGEQLVNSNAMRHEKAAEETNPGGGRNETATPGRKTAMTSNQRKTQNVRNPRKGHHVELEYSRRAISRQEHRL